MNKRALVGGVMAGAMLAGGCSSPSSSPEITFPDAGVSASAAPTFTPPEMHIPALPDKLPAPIAKVAHAAVGIGVGMIVNEGSGVRYNNDIVLTAGHVVSNEQTHQQLPLQKNCENLTAYAPHGRYGAAAAHDKVASIYNDTTDVAAFSLSKTLNNLPETSETLAVEAAPPSIGDEVYFVNYEPTQNHEMRSPTADKKAYQQPAIYGGVVVRNTIGDPAQTVEVLTGLKSYGAVPDTNTRPGASGGAAFRIVDGKAVLIGQVSRGELEGLTTTPEEVAGFIGVTPVDTPPNADLGLTGVQLVTPNTIATLEKQLQTAPACKFPNY